MKELHCFTCFQCESETQCWQITTFGKFTDLNFNLNFTVNYRLYSHVHAVCYMGNSYNMLGYKSEGNKFY